MVLMKTFVVVCLCGLSSVMPAAQSKLRAFTSPGGIFQFKYSSVLAQCSQERTVQGLSGSWAPEGCLCNDEDSVTTIVCFAYPKDKFKDKPTFVGAAFFVAEVRPAITPRSCLQGSRNWLVRRVQSARINSANFRHFRVSDAWTSHYQTGDIYRVFHDQKCYEVGIQEINANAGAYDPGTIKEFTKQDAAEVRAHLKQALDSFVFLR
jgi:hypothetical protein